MDAVKFNPSGSMFATGGVDRKIKLWEVIGGIVYKGICFSQANNAFDENRE